MSLVLEIKLSYFILSYSKTGFIKAIMNTTIKIVLSNLCKTICNNDKYSKMHYQCMK